MLKKWQMLKMLLGKGHSEGKLAPMPQKEPGEGRSDSPRLDKAATGGTMTVTYVPENISLFLR